jgi:pimeloyl-ACP methyl ester carboxylesterase
VTKIVAATRPDLVRSMVLLAPGTPPPAPIVPSNPAVAVRLAIQSLPGIGTPATSRYITRFSPRGQVEESLRIVMHDPSRLPADAFESAVALARLRRTMPWASRAFAESLAAIRRLFIRRSEYLAMLDAIHAPATLVFGSEDQVVAPSALRWLAEHRPGWRSIEMPDTGHTPMLERPQLVVREVERLVSRTGIPVNGEVRNVPERPGGRGYSGEFGQENPSAGPGEA